MIWIAVNGAILFAFIFRVRQLRRLYGREVMRRCRQRFLCLGPLAIFAIVFLGLMLNVLYHFKFLFVFALFVFSLAGFAVFVFLLMQKVRGGKLQAVVKCSIVGRTFILLIGVGGPLLMFHDLWPWIMNPDWHLVGLLWVTFYVIVGAILLLNGWQQIELRELGINFFGNFKAWSELRGFEWDGGGPFALTLRFLTQFPGCDHVTVLGVAQEEKNHIDDLLKTKSIAGMNGQDKEDSKKVFRIALFVFLGLCAFVLISGVYLFYLKFEKTPISLKKAEVTIGQGLLSKALVFEDPTLGLITDIQLEDQGHKGPKQLAIVGSKGAVFTDYRYSVVQRVKYHDRAGHVDLIEDNGAPKFMNRGGGWQKVSLIGSDGMTLWSYGDSPDDMATGDVNGNGSREFVVGFNGSEGVHLLNGAGGKQWQVADANVWHVEILEKQPSKPSMIIHSNASGVITVRGQDGHVIEVRRAPDYVNFFSVCPWPTRHDPKYLLFAAQNKIWLMSTTGGRVKGFNAPGLPDGGEARGAPVSPAPSARQLAVIVGFERWNTSTFYVFDQNGNIQYRETLPENCNAINQESSDDSVAINLLIGCQGKVWRYTLNR